MHIVSIVHAIVRVSFLLTELPLHFVYSIFKLPIFVFQMAHTYNTNDLEQIMVESYLLLSYFSILKIYFSYRDINTAN